MKIKITRILCVLLLLSVVNGLVFFWVNFNLSINAMGSFRAADERGCMPPLKDNEVYLIGIETSLPIRLPIKVNNVSLTSLDGEEIPTLTSLDGEEIPSCFILDLEETNWKMGAGVFDIKNLFHEIEFESYISDDKWISSKQIGFAFLLDNPPPVVAEISVNYSLLGILPKTNKISFGVDETDLTT